MDNRKELIAVASSDGIVVNQHFGRTNTFYIYKKEDDIYHFLEKRQVVPVCDCGEHDEDRLAENLEKIMDCGYLLVCRIGNGAASRAESMGFECYEIPGMIGDSIEQLIKYEKIKYLFN